MAEENIEVIKKELREELGFELDEDDLEVAEITRDSNICFNRIQELVR